MNSRDEIIDTISRVVTMELPGITTEADRRAKLGVIHDDVHPGWRR